MVPMQALPGHFCFTPHGHDWNFCVVMQKQLSLHISLHLASWSDSLHIESQLTSKESSHSPVSTVPLCFLMGILPWDFKISLSKSWFGRTICFHNFFWESILRNVIKMNYPHCFRPMILPQRKWDILAFSVHTSLLSGFFFPQEWENLNLKGNSMPFCILIHTTIIAEHACLILKIVNAGWFKSIHLLDWAKQFSELTLLKIFFKGWDNSKGIS